MGGSDDSKAYHDFRDSKIAKDGLETHIYISKYCLQIAKCNNIECCQSMRSNVQEVLGRMFLPAPLALSSGPYLIDPCKKDETQKISGFFQSLALQHLRPKSYKKCMKLPYDLYCPPMEASNANYVCPYILFKKICTMKELLLYPLKATQHHAFKETDMISIEDDMHEDEKETLDIVDDPCLIPDIE